MKNYLLVNRALAAEKNFNFFNNLFSRVKEHSSPTVNRRSTDGQSQRQYTLGLMKYAAMITLLLTLACGQAWGANGDVLFNQGFGSATAVAYSANTERSYSTSSTLSGLVGTGDNLFQGAQCNAKTSCGIAINTTSGANSYTTAGTFQAYANNTSFKWALYRTTNFAATAPTAIKFEMDVTPKYIDNKQALAVVVGSGFSVGTSKPGWAAGYTGFNIITNSTSTGKIYIGKVGGTASLQETTGMTSGTNYHITWVINATGDDLTYTGPDSKSYTLATAKWDMWVGTTRIISGQDRTKTGSTDFSGTTMQNLYIGNDVTGKHEVIIDNVKVTDLTPDPCDAADLTASNITSNGNQEAGTGITFSKVGSPASGDTWYWQTSATGTDKTYNATSPYTTATTAGSYTVYLRAYNTAGNCWGTAASMTNTIYPAPSAMIHNTFAVNDAWSSTIATQDKINITGLNAMAAVGESVGSGSNKSGLTQKIPSQLSEDASKYMSLSFNVASGKQLNVTSVVFDEQPVTGIGTFKVSISDNQGSTTKTQTIASGAAGSKHTLTLDDDIVGSFKGTVTVKVWAYGWGDGYRFGDYFYINGTVTDAAPSSDCSAYEFHYGTHDADDWETECFEQVGETNEWRIENFTIPSTSHYYVGYHGDGTNGWNSTWSAEKRWVDWPTKSDNKWQGQVFLAPNDGALGSFAVGLATGATGTLTIHSDYNDYNKYLSFTPDGYGITYGGSGHAFTETATSNMYETDVVTLPDVSSTTYTMGFQTATAGTYVTGIHSSAAENINAMGVTIKDGGKKKILLVPGSFNAASAKYAVYDVTNTAFDTDFMTDADGDGVYEGYVGSNCTSMILCRMSSSATTSDLSSANWEARWNQTGNISIGDLLQKYEITSLNGNDCAYTTTAMHPATSEKGKFRMWANSASSNWYVHWIPYYVLTYDANGGYGTTAQTERSSENSTLTVSTASNGFTAPTGYTFAGWATSDDRADAGTVDYAAGASYTLTANATLYAVWEAKEYTITLDDESATTSVSPSSVTATYNSSTIASITNPVKTGYTFGGWYSGDDGTGTLIIDENGDLQANTAYTGAGGIWTNDGGVTLHAKWTVNQYDVTHTFSNVSRTSGGSGGTKAATYGTDYSVTVGASSGYTLPAGISVTIGGDATTHYTWSNGTVTVDGNYILGNVVITISGVPTYTVTYSLNGGEYNGSSTAPTQAAVTSGTSITLPSLTPTKDGYVFASWKCSVGNTYHWESYSYTMTAANTTFTAQWVEPASMESGTLYTVDDIKPLSVNSALSSTGQYAKGISSNGVFTSIGNPLRTSNSDGTFEFKTEDKQTVDEVDFTKYMWFKGESNVTSNVPTSRGLKFSVGAAGTLSVYCTRGDRISLSDGTNTPVALTDNTSGNIIRRDVTISDAGTYYLLSTNSNNNIAGMKFVESTCDDLDAPDGLSAGSITTTGATFSITDDANTNNYEIYYSTSSTAPESSTPATTTTTSKSKAVTGLTVGTTYYAWVRSVCDEDHKSSWVAASSFSTLHQYAISYDKGEYGTGSISGGTKTEGTAFTLSSEKFTRSGYVQTGWTTSDGGTQTHTLGGSYTTDAAQTFYPVWSPVYTVTFNTNGTGSVSPITQTTYGGSISMPSGPSSTDSTFLYWVIGGNTYAASASYTPTSNITAYAAWKEKCSGGGGGSTTLISITPTITNDNKNNGSASASGTPGGTAYWDKMGTSSPYKLTSNEAYFALKLSSGYYQATDVVVINGADKAHLVYYGSHGSGTLLGTTGAPDKSGTINFTLTGLPSSVDEIYLYRTSDTYNGKVSSMSVTRSGGGGTCYYVTYNGNGAESGSINDATAYTSSSNSVTVLGNTGGNAFVRDGYTFNGWNTKANGSGDSKTAGGTFTITKDTVLYAQWLDATHSITYHCNDATSGCPEDAEDQTALPDPLPSAPSKTGYTFGGWFTDEDLTVAAVAGATLDADVDLYAKWCTNHTITWVVNGETYTTGTPTTSTNECAGVTTMPMAPADNTLSGCANSFRGWSETNLYGEATNTQPSDLFVTAANAPTIDADKTFYAVFGTATSLPQVGTVLWSESWTEESADAKPSAPTTSGSVVYGTPTITYSYSDGTGDYSTGATKVYNDNNAGGSKPELMVHGNKTTAGYFEIAGLPKAGARALTLTFKRTNSTTSALSLSVSGEGYSISHVSGSGAGTYVYTITCGSAETFSIRFTGHCTSSPSNTRIDDIVLKVKTDGATNYRCICPSLEVTEKLVTASTPIFITSAAGKTVRSQDSLRIVGSGLKKNATLSISSPASKFALKSRTGGDLTTSATGTINAVGYIYYTPDGGDTSDGLDKNNSFTITDGTNEEEVETALIGRHLPANFVIAAKSGDNWYALPANMSKSAPNVVPISVNDDDNPTTTSTSLANAYGLYTQHDSIELAMRGCSNAPLHGNATGASGNTNIGKSSSTNIDNIQNNPGYIWFLTQTNTSITNPQDAKYIISTPNNTYPLKLYETPNPKKWGLYSYSSSVVTEMRILTWTCANPAAPTISGETDYTVGDEIELTASHDGSNHDAMTTYTWYKGADWATASAASPVQAAATGSSGYTLTIASCTTDNAGTYWCEASNGTCSAHNSVGYAITVSEASCTPQSISKVVVTGSSAGTTSGYNNKEYVGTPVINVSNKETYGANIDGVSGNETGYKMTGNGTSIVFATLSKGTFQEGDVVKIGITKKNDTRAVDEATDILTIYYGTNKDDAAALTTISADAADFYEYELTSSDITTIGTKKGIGLFRESSNGENPYVYSVEIIGCRDWTTCTAPTAVVAGTITSNGATFTITDAENTLNYELYISEYSTTPTADATPTATSSSKTKVVSSLSASTTYYYWVRSNCGGYKSEWVAGASTFTTLAAATTYTVTYDGNSATDGDEPEDDNTYENGDVVTVLGNTGSLVNTGYTFVGWNTSSDGTGTFYPEGYKFYMGTANVTLYAVWVAGSGGCVKLTHFESSNHNPSSSKPDGQNKYLYGYKSSTMNASNALTITTDGSTNIVGQNSNTVLRLDYGKNIRIYADNATTGAAATGFDDVVSVSFKWKFIASGNSGKDELTSSYTVKVGSTTVADAVSIKGKSNDDYRTVTIDNIDKKDGYVQISIGGSASKYNMYIDDIEICTSASGASVYSVTFNKNGQGSFSQTISNVPSGSKIGAPIPAPTATGYEFGGWYREAGCSNAWNFGSNTITQDTTLYAKWTTCAPTISADPASGTSYNQNADATALSVTATGDDLTYQWYSNESNSNSDGTEIPGATSASYTPSTALVGTIYYYCVVTNDCGNATSAVATITVNDSKPNPTASWTIATPTHGGKGFSFSVTAYKNDGSTAWDGTLTTAMLSASEDVVLSGVTAIDNTISGTYGVKASATSPVTFYLELPSTETQAAATLSEDEEFTACSGTGVDGSTYEVPFLAKYSSSTSGKPSYYCESEHGYISPELGTSSVSLASEGYDDFDYYINSGRGSVLIFTKVDKVKKIQVYLNANSGPAKVTNVYTAASYSTALKDYTELTEKTDYTVTYTDEDSNTSIAKGKNGHVDIAFTTNIAEGTLVYVVLKEKAKYFGAKLTTGAGSGATIDTELAWSNSQADKATVVKGEDDAEFTITASRSGAAATASLGEIRYSSSDTKIATVNATTGEVTIADKISFGEDEYKTTTIKATLVSSGCYKSASITYTLQVNKSTCTEAAGTVAITSESDCSVELTVSGYEDGVKKIQWQKDGSDIPSATSTTYTATTSGTYTAVTTKDCARTSNSIVVAMSATATASKIVDSWYVKNGRRTPDIALVQTTGATSFTVKSGETTIWDEANSNTTGFGGCDFELKEDGIIYLHGTKDNGDAPSDLVAGNETITVTVSGCGGALSGLDIIIKKQEETLKPSVAFVVDGTTRAKGGTATSVSTAKTSERPLWTYLSSTFSLTGCNIYWSVDSKELREYYSQYDAIVVTDDPNTQTKGAGDVEYVKAFGTLVDVRPILTMEAYVGRYSDGGWHVYNATPTSPDPRQVEMKLECRNHEIFAGVSESSDNVRTETINGDEYWYITIVDTTQSPYKGTSKDYKDLPALQGFDPNSFSDMLGIGTIKEDELQAGVERQQEPAARMMILGIQNNAMGALTNEGKLIIKNAISYLLKTNMEEVDDCSNYFIGGTEGHTNDWTVATNWSKNSVPDFTTKVRLMAPVVITKYQKVRAAQVDIVKGGASKHIDGEPNGGLTINPGGALIVGGTVNRAKAPHYGIDDLQPTTDEDIFIKADENNSAALILDNSSGLTEATVQMYSPSYWEWKEGGTKIQKYWSYVAVPIQEALIPDYFYEAFTYYYEEKDGWKKKWDGDYLYPFQAIGLSRKTGGIENFWGPLVSTENREIPLTKTATGGGENMIANSWTAPIQIANFDIDDFGEDVKATIYMYNTGSASYHEGTVTEATSSDDGRGTAGQWLGIPIGVAKLSEYKGIDVIPALQTFEVDFESGVADGAKDTLHLDYDRLVRGIDITKDTLTERLHAPKRRMVKNDGDVEAVMKVRVAGIHTFAEVWLIQDGAFSEGYDNGWEANYAACDDRSPQLYAHSEIGNMGVIAKPELEGTILGFAPSRDGADYTFSFYYRGDEELYLNDLLTETSTPITNDDTYAFTASENGDGSRFIISRNPYQQPLNPTSTEAVGADGQNRAKKIIYNDKIYILYNGMIYDAMGRVINRK